MQSQSNNWEHVKHKNFKQIVLSVVHGVDLKFPGTCKIISHVNWDICFLEIRHTRAQPIVCLYCPDNSILHATKEKKKWKERKHISIYSIISESFIVLFYDK